MGEKRGRKIETKREDNILRREREIVKERRTGRQRGEDIEERRGESYWGVKRGTDY